MLVIHYESEDAPASATTETMKCLPARAHHERWRFLLMKWAERLEIRSRAFEWKIRADYFDDVVRGGDLLDCLRRDRSHARMIILPRLNLKAMPNLRGAAAFQMEEN